MGEGVLGTVAAQVCWNCKNGKRKCSKDLPACARCAKSVDPETSISVYPANSETRLLLKCDYEWSLADMNTAKVASSPASIADTPSSLPQLNGTSKLMYALSEGCPKAISLEACIPTQVLNIIISNGEGVPSVTSTYFRTIDVWLPVISAEPYVKKLETITQDNNVDLACLLLSMFLVTRPPGSNSGTKEMQTPLYFEAKTLYTLIVASGRSSTGIIQAGLLIGLYEIGHGIIEAAKVTMSVCSRMAMTMKVVYYRNSSANIQNTEFGRLWWGIVTLDR